MKNICLHGFYGYDNLGDEAILYTLLNQIKSFSNSRITIFTKEQKKVQQDYSVNTCFESGRKTLFTRILTILKSNIFLLGGGGLLKDVGEDSNNVRRWLHLLQLAQKLNKETALIAVGVENISHPESIELIKRTLNKTNQITVRDEDSKKILKTCGVTKDITVISDPVIMLTNQKNARTLDKSTPLNVLVSLRHWYNKNFFIDNPKENDDFLEMISNICDLLSEKFNAQITFVPLRGVDYDDDRIIANNVFQRMTKKENVSIIEDIPSIKKFNDLLENQDLVIGMRLHSLIFAATKAIPMIGLEYMPKVSHFMKSIQQEKYSLNLSSVTKKQLSECIVDSLMNYENRSKTILTNSLKLKNVTHKEIEKLFQ